jgi:predicted transcriptional regulator of viral defense system
VQSSHNQIELKIKKSPKGKIFFADDFVKFGSSENVRKVLSRLEKEGLLVRLAQGIYLVPKKDELLGTLYPTTEEIAKEIAKRDKARIAPTGSLALYQLGITTQVPLKVVYLTDGAQRVIVIGNRTIQFKKTTPRNLAIKDHLLMLITQALKEIGHQKVTDSHIQKLKSVVLELDDEIIKSQLKFAPVWVRKIINEVRN